VHRRLRRWRRKWLPRAPRWRQPFCPSVSASVGGPEQRMVQAADGTPIGRPLFKDRLAIVVLCAPIRALLGDKAFGLSLQVAFDTIIPTKHPYIAVFSKPRPVGRRRGATDIVVKQTDVGNPDSSAGADDGLHPGLPRAPALPEGSAIPVRPRGRRGRAGGGHRLFADARWRHPGAEERLILPAAGCALTDEAFRQDGAFRVGGKRDEAFGQMFARPMNMASEDEGR